jgi:hypothetical protein
LIICGTDDVLFLVEIDDDVIVDESVSDAVSVSDGLLTDEHSDIFDCGVTVDDGASLMIIDFEGDVSNGGTRIGDSNK